MMYCQPCKFYGIGACGACGVVHVVRVVCGALCCVACGTWRAACGRVAACGVWCVVVCVWWCVCGGVWCVWCGVCGVWCACSVSGVCWVVVLTLTLPQSKEEEIRHVYIS
jgi:hypothetical protein